MKDQERVSKPRNILEEIVWYKNKEIEEMRELRSVQALRKIVNQMPPTRNFKKRLEETFTNKGRPALIAEVKKASPSKGVIQPNFDPVQIAQQYEKGGASCLSVLTDKKYFQVRFLFITSAEWMQGGFENLKAILNAGVECPLLCKEFIIEAYQLFMARAHGADAVLLIAAVLPNKDLEYFMNAATSLGLQCLIEVHDENELERISKLKQIEEHLIGINNRNLETFEVDLGTTARLLSTPAGQEMLRRGILVVGESGIYSQEDVQTLKNAGCRAILVGESLVKENDPQKAVTKLLGDS